jgi:hypothetical protein
LDRHRSVISLKRFKVISCQTSDDLFNPRWVSVSKSNFIIYRLYQTLTIL